MRCHWCGDETGDHTIDCGRCELSHQNGPPPKQLRKNCRDHKKAMADLRALETLVENRDAISVDTIHRICVRLASIANTIKVAGHPEREQLEALTKSLEEAANHAGFCGGEESFFGALELLAAKLPTPMQREAVEVA